MPRVKKIVVSASSALDVKDNARIEVKNMLDAPLKGECALVVDNADMEVRRYTPERHGPQYKELADEFVKKHNASGKVSAKKKGYYIELIAEGKMTKMEYDRLVKAGVRRPGGAEHDIVEPVALPMKVVYK